MTQTHLSNAWPGAMQEPFEKDHSNITSTELAVRVSLKLVMQISQIVPHPDSQMVFVGAKENKI